MDSLRQLKYLDVLAASGNVGIAADKLGVTKSALSQTIKRLEDVYDAPLFVRDRQGIRPTIYGEILVEAARKGTRLFDDVRREFSLMRNLEGGRLLIGSDPATTEALLAPALAKIVSRFPKLHFELKEGAWADLEADIIEKRIDIFIGLQPDHPLKGVRAVRLNLPPMCVYCRPDHPLNHGREISLADGYDYPVMGTRMPDWYFERLAQAVEESDVPPKQVRDAFLFADDVALMRNVVQHSDALSATFTSNLGPDVEAGRLVVLRMKEAVMNAPLPAVIVTLKNRLLPPSALEITDAVKAVGISLMADFAERYPGRAPVKPERPKAP